MSRPKENAHERFMDMVDVDEESNHWIWNGGLVPSEGNRLWYGKFWLNGKSERAHRAAYMLFVGEIPPNKLVLHKCHLSCCVNPEHLYLGTQSDNAQDQVKRGTHVNAGKKLTKDWKDAISRGHRRRWEGVTK